jgi:hypothetical protein
VNKTTTVAVLLVALASIIGYRTGFFTRLGGAISGTIRVSGS